MVKATGKALAVVLLMVGVTLGQSRTVSDGLSEAEFAKIHGELTQAEDWRSVPWKNCPFDVRAQAVKENKPIFMFVMGNHPLGRI